MSRPYVRRSRPQRNSQCCTACDGAGTTLSEDYDEHGPHIVPVRCEGCSGLGYVYDCSRCDEPTPLPELEDGGGLCRSCRIDAELGDQAAEYARIRRVS